MIKGAINDLSLCTSSSVNRRPVSLVIQMNSSASPNERHHSIDIIWLNLCCDRNIGII